MQLLSDRFRAAMIELHRRKTNDYGAAWKKRGEVLSVLANIARKVDRLETVANRDVATRDEPILDTYIDLLVYSLKYETLLADLDPEVARAVGLPASHNGTHSDGLDGFEQIAATLDLHLLDRPLGRAPELAQDIATAFNAIERCFSGVTTSASSLARMTAVKHLVDVTVRGMSYIRETAPEQMEDFIAGQEVSED
jgi:hypothetical protein